MINRKTPGTPVPPLVAVKDMAGAANLTFDDIRDDIRDTSTILDKYDSSFILRDLSLPSISWLTTIGLSMYLLSPPSLI